MYIRPVRHVQVTNPSLGSRVPPVKGRAQEARRSLRMHSLCLLLDILPLVLVEPRGVPRPRCPSPIVPLDRRLARREDGRAPGRPEQQHELVPMPHYSQLLKDVPQGPQPRTGYCRD